MSLFTAKRGLVYRGQHIAAGDDFDARLVDVRDLLIRGHIEVSEAEADPALLQLDDRIQAGERTYLPKPRASAIRWTEAPAPAS